MTAKEKDCRPQSRFDGQVPVKHRTGGFAVALYYFNETNGEIMSLKPRLAEDGLYIFPTLTVLASQVIPAASYRLLNIIAGVTVTLDTSDLAANAMLVIYNTSLTSPTVLCEAEMSGQKSVNISPGKKLYLTWMGTTYVAELESVSF
jgi:hypothetical protein